MGKFEKAFGHWVINNRWLIIALTVLFVLGAASGMRLLSFDNDSRVFFSKENPQLKAFEAFENTYTKNENVVFVVAPENNEVFTRHNLTMLEELTEAAWKIPFSSRVDSITNFQYTWAEEDDLIVEDLFRDSAQLTDMELERKKGIALSEPVLVDSLISPSGHVTAVVVTILKPGKSMNETPVVAEYANQLADKFRLKYPEIGIHITGGIMIDNALGEATRRDISLLVPLMYFLLFLFLGIFLKSAMGTLGTLLVLGGSMVTGLGLAGWLGIGLTPSSANSPTIILTLAVADSVHILMTMLHQMRLGKTKYEAIAESLRINLQPVFLTSATTAIGFLTMNFSDAPPFRDLGNIVAIGVVGALVFSLTFLPAFMAVLPFRAKPQKEQSSSFMDRFAEFVIKRRTFLLWGSLGVVAILSIGIFKIELNDEFVKYYDKSFAFRRATDFMQENLTGFYRISYSLNAGESQGINDPEYLKTVEKFADWYRSQPDVVHVNAITDIVKRLNKNLHADDPNYYGIPEQRDQVAQYLLLYEMSLPFGLDLNNQINVDKSASRLSVSLKNVTSKRMIELDDQAREWLAQNAPENMLTYGVGMGMMFSHISERNVESMLGASIWALVIISFVIMASLRVFKLGFVFLIPNITPAMMAFGFWGFIVGRVGLAISVIAALTLGIVVDDTIHFVSKYLRARREYNKSPEDAVRFAFQTVGRALLVTTAVLVIGFSVLSFSGFQINADVGYMTVITMIFALALDFIFLPVLLMKAEGFINVSKSQKRTIREENNETGAIHVPAAAVGVGRDC